MNISRELALVINLRNTADDHKKHCGHNCNVSLSQIKLAAEYIGDQLYKPDECKQYNELMKNWPC